MLLNELSSVVLGQPDAQREGLERILAARSRDELDVAAQDRSVTLDVRLILYGARLAIDNWQPQPWTSTLLERIAGMPSEAWRSVLVGVDRGLPESAWVLAHALDDDARRELLSLGHPGLVAIAAAGLPEAIDLPMEIGPALAALIRAVATVRRELGEVPPPWSDRFMEQPSASAAARAGLRALPAALTEAQIELPTEPEITRVLADELELGDEDWVVYTLDAIAAEIAHGLEPTRRGALPPAIRAAWTTEWYELAHRVVEQVQAG